jgi:hypothetical protein
MQSKSIKSIVEILDISNNTNKQCTYIMKLLNNYKNISSHINEYLVNYITDNKENIDVNIVNNDQVFEYLLNTLTENDNLFSDVLSKIKI